MASEKSELRGFGLGVGGILLLLAALTGFGIWPLGTPRPTLGSLLGGIGGLLAATGALIPLRLRRVRDGWMRVVAPIAWFNTRLLLGLVYYGVLLPTGLIRRLGKDPLQLRHERQPSYWVERAPAPDRESYTRQI